MAIPFPDNISVGVGNPLDSRYLSNLNTPYIDTSAVTTSIVESQRYVGLTVNVDNLEYWFKDGILDNDLVLKSLGGTSILTGATNGLSLFSSGATVGLGGTLSETTTIDGAYTLQLTGDTNLSTDTGYQIGGETIFNYNDSNKDICIGCNILTCNTSGHNVGIGVDIMTNTTTGNYNIGIGSVLHENVSGSDNIAMGEWALLCNVSTDYNIALGRCALYNNVG